MRFDLPADKRLVFEMVIPIRWGDMDAMGHVNNAVYFRYLETLRIEWFRRLGSMTNPDGIGPVIINAFCTFIRQLEYPGDLLARHHVHTLGRSTVDTYATLSRTDQPDQVAAEGGATVVWTDARLQRSVPIPDAVRERLLRPVT
jgi:acyl-CoA thioester hydrolase